jgi:uncharacterized membrane protein
MNKKVLEVKPQGVIGGFFDFMFSPIMYLISGVWLNFLILRFSYMVEKPQRTHFYNNKKFKDDLSKEVVKRYPQVKIRGIETERWTHLSKFLFHVPILCGWKNYVVFRPADENINNTWHIGWINSDVFGVSKIPLRGAVRVLIGKKDCNFFAVRSSDNNPLPLKYVAEGKIGLGGKYRTTTLL